MQIVMVTSAAIFHRSALYLKFMEGTMTILRARNIQCTHTVGSE